MCIIYGTPGTRLYSKPANQRARLFKDSVVSQTPSGEEMVLPNYAQLIVYRPAELLFNESRIYKNSSAHVVYRVC